ncbi:hypothetical protein HDU77_007142 [Chytriomyces hyalinus]|nr:hypothetical protein HDU77_007142 [Chytriomyces hyalinus]
MSMSNIPYLDLTAYRTQGIFQAPHPPSTVSAAAELFKTRALRNRISRINTNDSKSLAEKQHGYVYYNSFDWTGFTTSTETRVDNVQACVARSVLGGWQFFTYLGANATCLHKRPSDAAQGIDLVFPTDAKLACDFNGICWNELQNKDFKDAFDLLDRDGVIVPPRIVKGGKECGRKCFKHSNVCAAASFQEDGRKCFFKQPLFTNDANTYAGVIWHLPRADLTASPVGASVAEETEAD